MARKYRLVMLTGAPRSGTTMMHSLLCTHPQSNPYVGEASYLHGLLKAWKVGLASYDVHTGGFFSDREAFRAFYADLIEQTLEHIWQHLGKPSFLILKDPAMATNILDFHQMVPDCRFVVSLRDPRAVTSSFLQVLQRQHGLPDGENGQLPNQDPTRIAQICQSYNRIYLPLKNQPDAFRGFVHTQKYEDLLLAQDFGPLAQHLDCDPSDFSFDRLWEGSEKRFAENSPYYAALWGKKADTSSIRKYERKLNAQSLGLIQEHCAEAFGHWYGAQEGNGD